MVTNSRTAVSMAGPLQSSVTGAPVSSESRRGVWWFVTVCSGSPRGQQDHIFPQDRLDAATLVEEHGIDRVQAEQFEDACDRVANLQLLTDEENARKQELPFEEWIRTRTDDYRERHCIPRDESPYQIDNFLQFPDPRDQLIRERVVETFQDITQERAEIAQD
jgi:hypothetical protein